LPRSFKGASRGIDPPFLRRRFGRCERFCGGRRLELRVRLFEVDFIGTRIDYEQQVAFVRSLNLLVSRAAGSVNLCIFFVILCILEKAAAK
jgi:hypothetical protein